ncbi:hypothetical protein ZWY2020_013808 [Hordeum vulgare]|nr:hypothetical protein ZWY2020_013808 [Hordeum vulgare]
MKVDGAKYEDTKDPYEDKTKQPDEETPPDAGFDTKDAMAELAVTKVMEMDEKKVIMESIQNEAYVECHRHFIRQERATTNMLFVEFHEEDGAKVKEPEQSQEPQLRLLPMYLESGTKTVGITE